MPQKRKRKRKFLTVDWKTLKKGDVIRVYRGTGPHMIIDGKSTYVGNPSGSYVVDRISEEGIHAYQGIGHHYIYMGEKKVQENFIRESHKIRKCL